MSQALLPSTARGRPVTSELLGESLEKLRLLYAVATALSTSLNLQETLRAVLKGLRECIAFDAATIFLLDAERDHLTVKAALGVTVTLDELKRFRVGEGVVGWVVEHNRPALIDDVARDPRYHATGVRKNQGALLAVPLRSGEQVIGALVLVRRAPRAFSEESRQLAEAIAGQAAIAIEHARVFETERHFRRRAEALLAASQAGMQSQSVDALLAVALQQLHGLLQADGSAGLLIDDRGQGVAASVSGPGDLSGSLKAFRRQPLERFGLGRELLATHRPIVIRRPEQRGLLPEAVWKSLPGSTVVAVPVRRPESLMAVLICVFHARREFTGPELELAQDVAAQFALGIVRLKLQRDVLNAQDQIAVVSERNRIARDLHDGIAQYVYALGLNLEHVRDALQTDPQRAGPAVSRCIEQANHVLAELRTFIYQLRPIIMREKEIGQWIRDLCQQFERATGIRVSAVVGASGGRELSPEISIALFRIIQEALANIYHHAGAVEASLHLTFGATGVRLTVEDRGRGFDARRRTPRSITGGHGLGNIRERVQDLGGVVSIESSPGMGTRLAAAIPYRRPPAHPQIPRQSDVA